MSNEINKISGGIVCPFCLNEFKAENVLFRTPDKYSSKRLDNILNEYWLQILGKGAFVPYSAIPVPPRSKERGLVNFINSSGKKIPMGYINEVGNMSSQRVCPECHNLLAPNAGFVNTANIMVMGRDSQHSFEYVKRLFESLQKSCIIDNVQFYMPQIKYVSAINSGTFINDVEYEETKFLMGKALFSTGGSVKCEFTITFMPFGHNELKNFNEDTRLRLLTKANGYIFVIDYNDVEETSGNVSPIEDYFAELDSIIGIQSKVDGAAPYAFVFDNIEVLKNLNSDIPNDIELTGYESNILQNATANMLIDVDTALYNRILTSYKNNCMFSVPSADSPTSIDIQNPLKWLINYFDIDKSK